MKFVRSERPGRYAYYRHYRQYTRRDFQQRCAHCFRHELEAGGEEHFVQDHFEPKHRPGVDPCDYSNLYWSCGVCNSRKNKGTKWPKAADLAVGERFCDPCDHDPVGTDYRAMKDGILETLSAAGTYTIRHIRLNIRPDLVSWRRWRADRREQYRKELETVQRDLDVWVSKLERRPTSKAHEKCRELRELVASYMLLTASDPFDLASVPPIVPGDITSKL